MYFLWESERKRPDAEVREPQPPHQLALGARAGALLDLDFEILKKIIIIFAGNREISLFFSP